MPGQGRVPKAVRSRPNDTARREAEMTILEDDGDMYGPDLPEGVLPDGAKWHPQTVALWDSLRRLPLLKDELPLGWQFLLDTALMHNTMWSKGRWEFASEVRLRLAKFGATPEDRMRLKIKVTGPTEESKRPDSSDNGSVSDIASRRARLTS
jgi:hypothetical protein